MPRAARQEDVDDVGVSSDLFGFETIVVVLPDTTLAASEDDLTNA